MKLIGYTTAYNVAEIVPIVMPYIELLGYDRFIVYDNMSTDNTVDLLKAYSFVEVRPWDTGGQFDDCGKRDLEISATLECRSLTNDGEDVWMTWTDFDEVMFYGYDIDFKSFLDACGAHGMNVFWKNMAQLVLPIGYNKDDVVNFIKNGMLAHTYPGCLVNCTYAKPILFHVNEFDGMYFIPGNHFALCDLKDENSEIKNITGFPLYIFHFKYYFPTYGVNKNFEYFNDKKNFVYSNMQATVATIQKIYGVSYPISMYLANEDRNIDINGLYTHDDSFWGGLYKKEDWDKLGLFNN